MTMVTFRLPCATCDSQDQACYDHGQGYVEIALTDAMVEAAARAANAIPTTSTPRADDPTWQGMLNQSRAALVAALRAGDAT